MIPRIRTRRRTTTRTWLGCLWLATLFDLATTAAAAAAAAPGGGFDNLHFFRQSVTQSSTTFGLLRSIPHWRQQYRQRRSSSSINNRHGDDDDNNKYHHDGPIRTTIAKEEEEENIHSHGSDMIQQQKRFLQVVPVAAAAVKTKPEKNEKKKTKKKKKQRQGNVLHLPTAIAGLSSSTGFFYGLDTKTLKKATTRKQQQQQGVEDGGVVVKKAKPLAMKEALGLTLEELRTMRHEMEALRKEMEMLKRQLAGREHEEEEEAVVQGREEEEEEDTLMGPGATRALAQSKRQREFEKIGRDVEKWAEKLLFQDDPANDGSTSSWTEVQCNKMLKSALNKDGQTRAYLQWMVDSRGVHANPKDDKRQYPCLRMEGTIDAPLDIVCLYLAQRERMTEYNDLLVNQCDVEEIAPHAKICWTQTPSLLFIKPRDFLTFCHHKWLKDGTQVVVNQGLDDHPKKEKLVQGRAMACAMRGANYISRDPENPQTKTRIYILAHGKPGVGVPDWACRTAINSLVPIEPFKFFAKLDESIKRARPALEEEIKTRQQGMHDSDDTDATAMASISTGRSKRPAGLAQLGYACFWPNGGGLVKGWQPNSVKTGSGSSSNISGDGSSSSNTEIAPQQVSSSDNDPTSRVERVEDSASATLPQSNLPQQEKDPAEVGFSTEPSSPDVLIERTTTLGDENDSEKGKPGSQNTPGRQRSEDVGVGDDGDSNSEEDERIGSSS